MKLQRAARQQARIRIGLQGPSGSGKTYGALLIAQGLSTDFKKVAVIDTEHNSASLYSHLGEYNVLLLRPPFTPEQYIQAIQTCEQAGMETIIIDSGSHEWEGQGGILDIHSSLPGNSFTNWSKVLPRHNAFIQTIMQSTCHVITTIRSKQDYVLVEKNGKQVPEKVGLKGIQRDGIDYEMPIVFDLDIKHNAIASKDRTTLFADKPEFKLSPAIGKQIRDWCNNSGTVTKEDTVVNEINASQSMKELMLIYRKHPEFQETLLDHFSRKRKEIESRIILPSSLNHKPFYHNATN